jgi:hypothetical protein
MLNRSKPREQSSLRYLRSLLSNSPVDNREAALLGIKH